LSIAKKEKTVPVPQGPWRKPEMSNWEVTDKKKDNKKLKTDTNTSPREGDTITYTKSKTT
jgi:hypothetical protein